MKEGNDFMLKTLAAQIKQYKKSTILTPILPRWKSSWKC